MDTLSKKDRKFLESLNTPRKIQDYLESIPFNHEENGETCMSPACVLKEKKAHCMEGALLSSVCLLLQKRRPLILSLRVTDNDYDHVVSLYKENGYWGAISKTNHPVLGFRDPVYKTTRELALSYFHEYFLLSSGEKTLRGYSHPISALSFGTNWIASNEQLFAIAEAIYDMPHKDIAPSANMKLLRKATAFEKESARLSLDGKE